MGDPSWGHDPRARAKLETVSLHRVLESSSWGHSLETGNVTLPRPSGQPLKSQVGPGKDGAGVGGSQGRRRVRAPPVTPGRRAGGTQAEA